MWKSFSIFENHLYEDKESYEGAAGRNCHISTWIHKHSNAQ